MRNPIPARFAVRNDDDRPRVAARWRELVSLAVEVAGFVAVVAGGWLIAPFVGLFLLGAALVYVAQGIE